MLSVPYLERSLGLSTAASGANWLLIVTVVVAACTAVATSPPPSSSERVGRKRVIYVACLLGAIGMTICALAPVASRSLIVGAILSASAAAASSRSTGR